MRGESKGEIAGECEGKERGENPVLEQEWYENDLQLAAELGKTLLERNKELETSLRQQQMIIDDNTLEIEHLSKQNNSLKEINESRLKVYEQLEISLQDLENANQTLQHEAKVDKSKIKSLNHYVESLEKKCEELQKAVDEARAASSRQHLQKRRERRRTLGLGMEFDAAELRRVMSVENGLSHRNSEQHSWDPEKEAEYLRLQQSARELKTQKSREQHLREELELETACLMQENEQLREQLNSLQQREVVMKALQTELQEMEEEFNSHRCCRHCRQRPSATAESGGRRSPTFLDSEHEVDQEAPQPSERCAVVKLRNGGLAYGSQETLVSAGRVLLTPGGRAEDEPSSLESSLLSELDAQYRLLIEKYEAMVSARRLMELPEAAKDAGLSDSDAEDEIDDAEKEYRSLRPWAATEESSSLSSGFSEDLGQAHKAVQTDRPASSGGASPAKGLAGLRAQRNPFENHFNHTPEYKKLFQEIFAVLKKTISYEAAGAPLAPADTFPPLASREGTPSDGAAATPPPGRSYADVARTRFRSRK